MNLGVIYTAVTLLGAGGTAVFVMDARHASAAGFEEHLAKEHRGAIDGLRSRIRREPDLKSYWCDRLIQEFNDLCTEVPDDPLCGLQEEIMREDCG